MVQFPRLSSREWDVLRHLLDGKSNKLIASSLGVSVRTVEFHLKNIYAKFQVSSRIELILQLGKTTGRFEIEKLGRSTVAGSGGLAENRDGSNSRMSLATSLGETVSMIGEELEMKNIMQSKHVLVDMAAALLTGFLLVAALKYSGYLSVDGFNIFTVQLVIVLATIGLIVGEIGKQRRESFLKVLLSVTFATGLAPFTVIPLMMFVAIPIGKVAASMGLINPSTIPAETASAMAMSIMLMIWLIVGISLGSFLLLLSIKIKPTNSHSEMPGNA